MRNLSSNSIIAGFPYRYGQIVKYREYNNPKIGELIKKHSIKNIKDFTSNEKNKILSKEIIEKLFVKDFLNSSIKNYSKILSEQNSDPDFRVKENGEIALTVEVYTPSFTKRVLDKSRSNKDGIITYASIDYPLHSDMVTKKINKYFKKYPNAKQCLFLFFVNYLNEKCVMRAFYDFYGDTLHSNGALAHNNAKPYCAKEEMENVAGFFFTEGHINIKNATLEYQDIIFAHNPFCRDGHNLSFSFFKSGSLFQSYIQLLNKKPKRGEYWGNFLIRFYQNKYPNYSFLNHDIHYCKQYYTEMRDVSDS